jgi:hypothetical protein
VRRDGSLGGAADIIAVSVRAARHDALVASLLLSVSTPRAQLCTAGTGLHFVRDEGHLTKLRRRAVYPDGSSIRPEPSRTPRPSHGPAWKALIEEEFGDGIMSAIDFDVEIELVPNPRGDRVKITMSGKFLPYKYYGNEAGILDHGVKES